MSICPAWCNYEHSPEDFLEEDLFHSKHFGKYDDGERGIIKVGINQVRGRFMESDIWIDTVLMENAQDLRDLARDCLEAAKWMDENLGTGISLVSHGE